MSAGAGSGVDPLIDSTRQRARGGASVWPSDWDATFRVAVHSRDRRRPQLRDRQAWVRFGGSSSASGAQPTTAGYFLNVSPLRRFWASRGQERSREGGQTTQKAGEGKDRRRLLDVLSGCVDALAVGARRGRGWRSWPNVAGLARSEARATSRKSTRSRTRQRLACRWRLGQQAKRGGEVRESEGQKPEPVEPDSGR